MSTRIEALCLALETSNDANVLAEVLSTFSSMVSECLSRSARASSPLASVCRLTSESALLLCVCVAQLSIQEVFKTPNERRGAAPEIVGLFEWVVNKNLPPHFIKFLSTNMPSNLQALAATSISHIALGVRIASMPLDNLLHPQHSLFRRALIAGPRLLL